MARQLIVLALVLVAFVAVSSAQAPNAAPQASISDAPAFAPEVDSSSPAFAPEAEGPVSDDFADVDAPVCAPASAPAAEADADAHANGAGALKVSAGIGAAAIAGFMLL